MWEKRLSNDWFVVFVVIFLFLIPLYLIPEIPLFGPSIVGNASNYGFVVYIVLILDFVWWVAKESKAEHFPEKHFDHPRVPMEQATSCHWVRCWMSRWRTNVAYREWVFFDSVSYWLSCRHVIGCSFKRRGFV